MATLTKSEYAKAWYQKNRARVLAARKARYAADPETAKLAERERRARDPEKHRAKSRFHGRRRSGAVNPTGETRSGSCENSACTYVGPLCWDHDHGPSRAFRGWLCANCNTAAGLLADDPERARGLADYLTRTQSQVRISQDGRMATTEDQTNDPKHQ